MKDKIIEKASELFLKLGFKSVTMDDIACEMCISKKTIYKYFCNKEILIEESTRMVHEQVTEIINSIVAKNYNAIKENFEIRQMFKETFQSTDASPLYQLKKHYPDIYRRILDLEIKECKTCFENNISKGISEGLYRENIEIEHYADFYYALVFNINENTKSENEARKIELLALEYHTRAMATQTGIQELEKQLNIILQQENL
ncbi:TetR/AcrR family transcriptional regulator [Flavobacterium agrisoli]|uniref:TetR/AcrR family transcriptional regulator n=1 Tax=Flavobacterium agrisoli TaxID=2793066 RepID=A0A934PM49_9FLAO|nr:TetR/AcrR family transcriptional regulator [Flavobacterium agrisoli]MBK0369364.1 TetR/AcrR family transcriptional regulator [Flavobacterium agrisoli]